MIKLIIIVYFFINRIYINIDKKRRGEIMTSPLLYQSQTFRDWISAIFSNTSEAFFSLISVYPNSFRA